MALVAANLLFTPTAHADTAVGKPYGGGTIAYILQPGDAGYSASTAQGIIVSNSDLGSSGGTVWGTFVIPNTPAWQGSVFPCIGALATGLLQGKENTATILARGQSGSYAALVASQYSGGGFNDWVLPSSGDLDQIYANQKRLGAFPQPWYWSSTEPTPQCGDSQNLAYARNFATGLSTFSIGYGTVFGFKGYPLGVRAVRYFQTPAYTLGGTLSGLPAGTSTTLQNNGGDSITLQANGSFSFPTSLPSGANYRISAQSSPPGYTCAASNGVGSISANISNISVTCARTPYQIGGTVSGLPTGGMVTLSNNGAEFLTRGQNGAFQFSLPVLSGGSYAVSVTANPAGYSCTASNASGIANGPVSNIGISCTRIPYTIGGTVNGLPTGGMVTLNNNGAEFLTLSQNGAFQFTWPVLSGDGYTVSVTAKPTGYNCSASNASGTAQSPVSNIGISCAPIPYPVSGSVSDLPAGASVLLQLNGGGDITLKANGPFSFSSPLPYGSAYRVIALSSNADYTCRAPNRQGTVNGPVTLAISCQPAYSVIYSFPAGAPMPPDAISNQYGAHPRGGLTQGSDGTLYGQTADGGANGGGTLFSFSLPNGFSLLQTFGSNDGYHKSHNTPLLYNNTLYGMTASSMSYNGKSYSQATAYTLSANGAFKLLYAFPATANARTLPGDGLMAAKDGFLYGTTVTGGTFNRGSVFKISSTGSYTTVHNFGNGSTAGSAPQGALVQTPDGTLYGTTADGGVDDKGVIYSISPQGKVSYPYAFRPSAFGSVDPAGALLLARDGNLYGLAKQGGSEGRGTVYKMSPGGTPVTVYSFGSQQGDGCLHPTEHLIQAADGNLYGVCGYWNGRPNVGALFRVSTKGDYAILHLFGSSATDGGLPRGAPLEGLDGNLYGTTLGGGDNKTGSLFRYLLP